MSETLKERSVRVADETTHRLVREKLGEVPEDLECRLTGHGLQPSLRWRCPRCSEVLLCLLEHCDGEEALIALGVLYWQIDDHERWHAVEDAQKAAV